MLALTLRRALHQARMVKLLLLHPNPSYTHLDSRKSHCWLSFVWGLSETHSQQHQQRQSSGLRWALIILALVKRSVNKAQHRQRTERQ